MHKTGQEGRKTRSNTFSGRGFLGGSDGEAPTLLLGRGRRSGAGKGSGRGDMEREGEKETHVAKDAFHDGLGL